MRQILAKAFGALLAMAAPLAAAADDFPSRSLRIIVPYAAGGPSDTGARLVQDALGRELGQPVVVENRGGGGGLNGDRGLFPGRARRPHASCSAGSHRSP